MNTGRGDKVKSKLLLLLILGLIGIIMGFVFSSCGTGPLTKITINNKGAFALDFGNCSSQSTQPCYVGLGKSISSLDGLELTVEAWVKSATSTGTTLQGGIFSRAGTGYGCLLFVDGEAKFAMKNKDVTFTPYIVDSGFTFSNSAGWTHVAGVYANNHANVHATTTGTCTASARAGWHLDIYINGVFQECAAATTLVEIPANNEMIGRSQVNQGSAPWEEYDWQGIVIDQATKLQAVVDEVRFWRVARTPDQIANCRSVELSVTGSGDCSVVGTGLIGYWRFNEGNGLDVADISGVMGNSGQTYYCDANCSAAAATSLPWEGGWTTGYQF